MAFRRTSFRICLALVRAIAGFFTVLVEPGKVPGALLEVLVTPPARLNKSPTKCSATRPISLICVWVKVLEMVGLYRVAPELEPALNR